MVGTCSGGPMRSTCGAPSPPIIRSRASCFRANGFSAGSANLRIPSSGSSGIPKPVGPCNGTGSTYSCAFLGQAASFRETPDHPPHGPDLVRMRRQELDDDHPGRAGPLRPDRHLGRPSHWGSRRPRSGMSVARTSSIYSRWGGWRSRAAADLTSPPRLGASDAPTTA